MEQIQLVGNLGKDPEMNVTGDGTPFTRFSMGVSRKVKGQDHTNWYNIVAWRQAAEIINQYTTKGAKMFIQGTPELREYTKKDGTKGYSLDVTVEKFEFLSSKAKSQDEPAAPYNLDGDEFP